MSEHHILDARNLLCPMPVIRAQNRVRSLEHGDRLTVRATDPGARHDLPCWCRINGHAILEERLQDHLFEITLQIHKEHP